MRVAGRMLDINLLNR